MRDAEGTNQKLASIQPERIRDKRAFETFMSSPHLPSFLPMPGGKRIAPPIISKSITDPTSRSMLKTDIMPP
ncbi:MAG: hypothetical protein A3J10_00765 [Candidatus Sungbacteria bacterium RIFCSPLOWO2_02_FULL_54_10]|nr:MAG: hypothetical protein A3J10_00765 [Candidatus Sungbacteria bacterium RIFCSPLOWO2_02_FULL_54_10]